MLYPVIFVQSEDVFLEVKEEFAMSISLDTQELTINDH
jgi:hypothetical protein